MSMYIFEDHAHLLLRIFNSQNLIIIQKIVHEVLCVFSALDFVNLFNLHKKMPHNND
jgi:hypothetical protein